MINIFRDLTVCQDGECDNTDLNDIGKFIKSDDYFQFNSEELPKKIYNLILNEVKLLRVKL